MLEPGTTVERYEVLRPLGEGGMAKVVLVRHTMLGTLHALKVLTLTGPTLKERLVEEGKAQAVLRHENVVRVSDVLVVDGMPALVMDFIDGPDLGEWIRRTEPGPAVAEQVFRGIVSGVAAAHRAGRIHRDLKPANVLLHEEGDRLVPKVADFGLVKAVGGDDGPAYATRAGVTMGTPRYMAPEQFRDAANVDHRADIFALGAILYELLAHHPAAESTDLMELYDAASTGKRDPLPKEVPEHLRRVVDACMRPSPAERPQTCEAVLALLDGDRSAASVSVTPRSSPRSAATLPMGPAVKAIRPAPAPLLVAGVALTIGAGSVAVVVLLTVAVWAWTLRGGPDGPCPIVGGPLGVARFEGSLKRKKWVVPSDTPVLATIPTGTAEARTVCLLEAGTVVSAVSVREVDGTKWATIVAEDIVQGDEPEPEPEGDPSTSACEGEPGERVGWFRTRPRFPAVTGPQVGQAWRPGAGREVVEHPPTSEHGGEVGPVVCVLGDDEVMVVEPPVKIGKDFWVPYVLPRD